MNAKVFLPQVPTWLVVVAAVCWVTLTALSALLVDHKGFPAEMAKQLLVTAATVAFGISGVGAFVQAWQLRRMRQRTGPLAIIAIEKAVKACGVLASTYATAGSALLRGASAVDTKAATVLLGPPLLPDGTDIAPFSLSKGWGNVVFYYYQGVSTLGGVTNLEDVQIIDMIGEASTDLIEADAQLQWAVRVLADFDVPGADTAIAAALRIRSTISDQLSALRKSDQNDMALACWLSCYEIFKESINVATSLNDSWHQIERMAGRRKSPLEVAVAGYLEPFAKDEKKRVLDSISRRIELEAMKAEHQENLGRGRAEEKQAGAADEDAPSSPP